MQIGKVEVHISIMGVSLSRVNLVWRMSNTKFLRSVQSPPAHCLRINTLIIVAVLHTSKYKHRDNGKVHFDHNYLSTA